MADFARRITDVPAGRLLMSRVHGDLNLTNILVCRDAELNPRRVYLIDLARSDLNQATATDLARLEAEFWAEFYLDVVAATPGNAGQWLADFLAVCAYLDGQGPAPRALRTDYTLGAMYFIYHLRRAACTILRRPGTDPRNYRLDDYYHCLYFTFLKMLLRGRYQDPKQIHRSCLALHGASLALRVLNDLRDARYSEDEKGAASLQSPCREIEELQNFSFSLSGTPPHSF